MQSMISQRSPKSITRIHFTVAFPTGQHFLVPRDKGTSVPHLTWNKRTTGQAQNHTTGRISSFMSFQIRQFVTEEILCIIERERTMAHYCTHLCRRRTILQSITAGIRSREFIGLPSISMQSFLYNSWASRGSCWCWQKWVKTFHL